MNALVISDLHLEFSTIDLDISDADIVVLAGDIHLGARALPWIQQQCADIPVIYVPGNHEFYRGEYSRVLRIYVPQPPKHLISTFWIKKA